MGGRAWVAMVRTVEGCDRFRVIEGTADPDGAAQLALRMFPDAQVVAVIEAAAILRPTDTA